MKITAKIMSPIIILLSMLMVAFGPVRAQEKAGHSHEKAELHGGAVAMSKHHHFEVVFKADAIHVYLYDGVQKPLASKGVVGTVTLRYKNAESRTLPLHYASSHSESSQAALEAHHEKMDHHEKGEHKVPDAAMTMDYLHAKVDLSHVKPDALKATFDLKNLPDKKEPAAKFTATFRGLSGKKPAQGGHKEHSH